MKELTTVGSNALILETPEDEVLGREASLIERRAEGVPVTNDVEFASAGGLLKEIKQMQKKVKEYWEPEPFPRKRTQNGRKKLNKNE